MALTRDELDQLEAAISKIEASESMFLVNINISWAVGEL
jgi:BMFP domain-containing protein YqiC